MDRLIGAALAAVLSTFGAACGATPRSSSSDAAAPGITTQPAAGTVRTTIYFLTDAGAAPLGVRRTIRTSSPCAREALRALLAGPSKEEAQSGIATAIPADTRLLSLTFEPHGADTTVNLAGLPQDADAMQTARIITQVARSLIGRSGIERIWLQDRGRPWGLVLRDGSIVNGPFDYGDLAGWDVGAGCRGTESAVCDRFDALP